MPRDHLIDKKRTSLISRVMVMIVFQVVNLKPSKFIADAEIAKYCTAEWSET